MYFKVETGPATEPLTTAEVKDRLKIDHPDEDDMIDSFITGARQMVEDYCSMGLILQTVSQTFDDFPSTGPLYLHYHPFVAITSITYTDTEGATQTLTTDKYTGAGQGFLYRVGLKNGQSWPNTASEIGAVKVTYQIGYADADSVPDNIKAAMVKIIGQWHAKREDSVRKMPTESEFILSKYRLIRV